MSQLIDSKNLTLAELTASFESLRLPPFRARQVFAWLYRHGVRDFSQMTDLKKELRQLLAARYIISDLQPEVIEKSSDGTIKFGFLLADGLMIESVLIPENDRRTLCVSSQAGCAMGCSFCLTAGLGFQRNLQPAEIVGQVTATAEYLATAGDEKITNLVFMGMGEPLANFDNLLRALSILTADLGLDFSERRITVSTCGIVPKIAELGSKTAVNLAISLHSVDNQVRQQLMPINRKYSVESLLQACRDFPLPPRRRIMFEYILINGLNDSVDDARHLARALRGLRCKINLLPLNEADSFPYRRPAAEKILTFQEILWQEGYTVLIRESRGADISAACGQLAGAHLTIPSLPSIPDENDTIKKVY